MNRLIGTTYNDGPIRNAVIEFCKKQFEWELEETPPEKRLIDLVSKKDPLFGIEVEHGKWKGDFWVNDSYSLISGMTFRTVNIPIRKEKYWMEKYTRYNKEYVNPSYLKNMFIRSNFDFTQFIVIKPETIRNPDKVYRTTFQPNNSFELENWLSFKKEDVDTYNLVNGTYTLDKNEIQ